METETRQIHNFHAGDRFHEHYRLLEHVGSGGFADVWKAKDELVDTIVALKIYTRLDKEGISELAKEYKDMRGIKHPNLLTGNHFDASGNIPYLEMDYCDGGSLFGKIGKMSNQELHRMVGDVANGLAYLHKEGIVHQDIKPENILYDTEHGRYLLSDFGISSKSRTRLSHSVNKANMTLSMTEAYAPPEKFSGNMSGIAPDTKGDIFSLGMTLFELAVGKLPFDPPMAAGREMFYSQGRLQLDYSKIADPLLRSVVERCTKYSKDNRPAAGDILLTLNGKEPVSGSYTGKKPPTVTVKIDGSSGTVGGRESTPYYEPSKPVPVPQPRRKGIIISAVAALVVVLLFVIIINRIAPDGNSGGVADTVFVTDYDTRYGKWTGPLVNGKPDGKGVLVYYSYDQNNRARYEGKMRKGIREDPYAVLEYKNGNTYTGYFLNDELYNGNLSLENERLHFKGRFKNNQPYDGKWYLEDGSVYSKVTNGVERKKDKQEQSIRSRSKKQ